MIEQIDIPILKKPNGRIFFARTNDLGFAEKRWIILDKIESFESDDWPMPPFRSGAVGTNEDDIFVFMMVA